MLICILLLIIVIIIIKSKSQFNNTDECTTIFSGKLPALSDLNEDHKKKLFERYYEEQNKSS